MPDIALSLLFDKIARANEVALGRALARDDLRPRHAGLLAAVAALDAPSQLDVGEWLGVGPSSVVLLVDELVQRGQLVREVDPSNRRRSVLRLTAAGQAALERASTQMAAVDRRLLDAVGEGAEEFDRALRCVASALGVMPAVAT